MKIEIQEVESGVQVIASDAEAKNSLLETYKSENPIFSDIFGLQGVIVHLYYKHLNSPSVRDWVVKE
jgi:hypothetical protein